MISCKWHSFEIFINKTWNQRPFLQCLWESRKWLLLTEFKWQQWNFLNAQKQSIFDDSDTYFDYLRAAKMNIEQVEAFGQEDPIVEYY
jgi:hypothetical protein